MEWLIKKGEKVTDTLNIGDTIVVDDVKSANIGLHSVFNSNWKHLMDNNFQEWTILEREEGDLAKITNRFTTRATRMNGYEYADGYEFRCIRRSPYSYFLGRKV